MTLTPLFFHIAQSTVLSGVESQLLVFFKTSPDFSQQPARLSLQCLLILTYVALIFSVSATISSLALTRNPRPIGGLQKNTNGKVTRGFEIGPLPPKPKDDTAPQRWSRIELHCAYHNALLAQPSSPTNRLISRVVHASRVCAVPPSPDLLDSLDG